MGFRSTLKTQEKGFSLVEILIAASISSFLLITLVSLYFGHFKIFSNQTMAIDVSSQLRLGLHEIANQIRQAQTVVATCTNCGSDQTGPTVLILQLWPLNSSNEPFEPTTSGYDYIIYKRSPTDDTKLLKRIIPDPTSSRKADNRIISVYVSNLGFTYNNADPTQATEITVSLTTTKTAFGKNYAQTQSEQILMRNK